MAKQKFYAVRKGRKTGIFNTWPEAQKQVSGFPGAEYKSFKTKEEAEAFLKQKEQSTAAKQSTETLNASIEAAISAISPKKALAFIDGSYGKVKEREKYSFGAVIITDTQEVELFRGYVNPAWIAYRNVAGEIQGAMEVIRWAIDHGKAEIDIYYDYQGIEKWAIGDWRANSAVAVAYVKFIQAVKDQIAIRFFHVPAHTGVDYNERVDDLAKAALSSQHFRTHDAMSMYFTGLNQADWVAIYEALQAENRDLGLFGEIKTKTEETDKEYPHRIVLAEGDEKAVVNLYGRDKAYVEGHPESRFYQRVVLLAVGQLLTDKEVWKQLNQFYQADVDYGSFQFAIERLLSNIHSKEVNGTLWSAVYGVVFQDSLLDYTPLVIPVYRALRALEIDAAVLDKLRDLYVKWIQAPAGKAVLADVSAARELIEDGLHLMNKYHAK